MVFKFHKVGCNQWYVGEISPALLDVPLYPCSGLRLRIGARPPEEHFRYLAWICQWPIYVVISKIILQLYPTIYSCNVMFDLNHVITLFCSFSFFFCCQTSYARVIMDRSRPTRVAKKIPPSDCRVIPLESSVMGHVWRYLLFQYVANQRNKKSTM